MLLSFWHSIFKLREKCSLLITFFSGWILCSLRQWFSHFLILYFPHIWKIIEDLKEILFFYFYKLCQSTFVILEIKAEKMLKMDLFKIIVYPLYVNINNIKNSCVFSKIKFYKDGIGFHFANLLNIWLNRRLWGFHICIFILIYYFWVKSMKKIWF